MAGQNALHPFSRLNAPGIQFIRHILDDPKWLIKKYLLKLKSGKAGNRPFQILDIGCGDFQYLRNGHGRVSSVLSFPNIKVTLVDPKEISIPKSLQKKCFHYKGTFQEFFNKTQGSTSEKFDLIILSTVVHELYLKWCLERVLKRKKNDDQVTECGRNTFCEDLFKKLMVLLNVDGHVLFIENYYPKRISRDEQLLAREIQFTLIGHADSPAAFFPTEEYVDAAEAVGFRCCKNDSVRCVNLRFLKTAIKSSKNGEAESALTAFEGRRFGCKLFRIGEGGRIEHREKLRRGFLFDMSNIVNIAHLNEVLCQWVKSKGKHIDKDRLIREEYKNVFWNNESSSMRIEPVFHQLIRKCFEVVGNIFDYEDVSDPKLFSCWVSINSLITKGRFIAVDESDGKQRFTPIIRAINNIQVYKRSSGDLEDWNEIAFNTFSSIDVLQELFRQCDIKGIGDSFSGPSVYNYMRTNPSIRSLTLTYARQNSRDKNVQLATQEDALNALDLFRLNGTNRDENHKHHLIVVDFGDDSPDSCLKAAGKVNDNMENKYYVDVKEHRYIQYLTAIYLDFLFLRRYYDEEPQCEFGELLTYFRQKWFSKINTDLGDMNQVGRKLKRMIWRAVKEAKKKFGKKDELSKKIFLKAGTIDELPRAFLTFSIPSYWQSETDSRDVLDVIKQPPGSLMIFSDKVFSKDAIDSMVAVTERTFVVIRTIELKWIEEMKNRDLLLSNTRSAIGSIMSRNGSHNIGSHVLSALSHNVGTMPDDRVLYQYIQHRMDYIATATTEFPTWTVPTMFVAGLMKTFYSQKHLLNYISRSEGLRAYKFQDRNLDDVTRMNQHGTIRIFVRKLFNLGTWGDKPLPQERTLISDPFGHPWCIHYSFGEKGRLFHTWTDGNAGKRYEVAANGGTAKFLEYAGTCEPDWKQDVSIAIPGGVVGQHAFYTILENVIRNAAKHSWASGKRCNEKDLEINVDFEEIDKAGEHIVLFTIGDNISNVFGDVREREFWKAFFSLGERPRCKSEEDQIAEDKRFLTTWINVLHSIGMETNRSPVMDELTGGQIIKDVYDELAEWALVKDVVNKESMRKIVIDVDGFLARAFAAPLSADDAILMEKYLRETDKDSGRTEELPLIYKIQRLFLETSDNEWSSIGITPQFGCGDVEVAVPSDKFVAREYEPYPIMISQRKRWVEYKNILTGYEPTTSNDINLGRRLILPLHHDQHRKLAQSFIASSGKLRKENWGLAEMKISAGYLGQKSIEEIGGLNGDGADIVVPIAMPAVCRSANSNNCIVCSRDDASGLECGEEEGDCPARSPYAHLGYSFKIPKAKNVLVVAKDDTDLKDIKLAICGDVNTDSWHEVGINFRVLSDDAKSGKKDAVNGERNLNYRYVVFSCAAKEAIDNQKEQVQGQANKNQETIECTDEVTNSTVAKDVIVERFCFRQLKLHKQEGKYELRDVCPKGAQSVRIEDASPEAFLRAVYSAWLRSLVAERKAADVALISKPISLNLNVSGNEAGREKGLVTTQNLLHTMFIECGHSAFMDFYENPPEGIALCDTTRNIVMLLSLIRFCDSGESDSCSDALEVIPESTKPYGESMRTVISTQLAKCCDFLKDGIPMSDEFIVAVREINRYVPGQKSNGDVPTESSVLRKIGAIRNDFEVLVARRLMAAKSDENDTVRNGCEELAEFLVRTDKRQLDGWLDAFHGDGDSYEAFDNYREVSYEEPHDFVSNLKAVLGVCAPPAKQEFDALVDSLYAMFLASDVYLRKYEERIATLPIAYKAISGKRRGTGEAVKKLAREVWSGESVDAKDGDEGDPFVIKYSRHDATRPKDAIYSEALSGSQSYLNMLAMLAEESWAMDGDVGGEQGKGSVTNNSDASKEADIKRNEKIRAMGQIARLLENAFLRILIIDERVANFLRSHRQDRMIETFSNMNIRVVDVENAKKIDTEEAVKLIKEESLESQSRDELCKLSYVTGFGDKKRDDILLKSGEFDLLIIHQGIIDKWWSPHKKEVVGDVLSNIRRRIPRVVITTGRGRPDNIPDSARVLPFSCIESSLFKRYPEKLVLTSTVLNVLPGKSDEKKGD